MLATLRSRNELQARELHELRASAATSSQQQQVRLASPAPSPSLPHHAKYTCIAIAAVSFDPPFNLNNLNLSSRASTSPASVSSGPFPVICISRDRSTPWGSGPVLQCSSMKHQWYSVPTRT